MLRERYVLFWAAQEIGYGEKNTRGKEKGRKRDRWNIPLCVQEMRDWASFVLRNGLNHSQRGCSNSQPHRPPSKRTSQWWMILMFTPSAFNSLLSQKCVHNMSGNPDLAVRLSRENNSLVTINSVPSSLPYLQQPLPPFILWSTSAQRQRSD